MDFPPVIALVRDLMFVSRITATARDVGSRAVVVRNPKDLPDHNGTLLLADLNLEGALEAAAQWRQTHNGQVVGFVSHTDAQTISRAREAGLDRVMSRGGFVEALPGILKGADVR